MRRVWDRKKGNDQCHSAKEVDRKLTERSSVRPLTL